MARKRTLLDAVGVARRHGATITAPVSHNDLRIVFAVLDEMGIEHNLEDESFYKGIIKLYPTGYSGAELMAIQAALPRGPRRGVDRPTRPRTMGRPNPRPLLRQKSRAEADWWLEQDGKMVTLDGLKYRIRAKVSRGVYPYEANYLDVYAEPASKRSKKYRDTRRALGDDWVLSVTDSPETEAEVMRQLGYG